MARRCFVKYTTQCRIKQKGEKEEVRPVTYMDSTLFYRNFALTALLSFARRHVWDPYGSTRNIITKRSKTILIIGIGTSEYGDAVGVKGSTFALKIHLTCLSFSNRHRLAPSGGVRCTRAGRWGYPIPQQPIRY